MWAERRADVVRLGFDDLGQETHGDIAFLQLAQPGTTVSRGGELGTLEAGKYVGPIFSPISGTISAANQAILDNPRLINTDPFGQGWLVELKPAENEKLDHLLGDPEVIRAWFDEKVRDFQARGVLAE
jgi:glycine cleavage system H protein